MRRLTILILCLPLCQTAVAQLPSGLIDSQTARRAGLQVMWSTQLRVDSRRGEMAGGNLHVSSTDGTAVFQVREGEQVLETFTDKQLDPFGEPLGREGAEKKAVLRVAELKKLGRDVAVKEIDVPDILYVATSSRGMVHAIDAETGRTRWTTLVGRPEYVTSAPSVNNKYVGAINGLSLFVLERATGNLVFNRSTDGAPIAAPALSENFAFVISSGGMMQSYPLYDEKGLPGRYQSHGQALVQPVVTPRSVVWPTDKGHFYIAPAERRGISYRIESDRTAVAPAAYRAPYFLYVVATDGYVYCVHEVTGNMIWSYPLAESVSEAPVAIGDSLYVVTDESRLYCLDSRQGRERWWQEGVMQFVARSDPYVYCLDSVGRLAVLDAKSGGRIQTLPQYGISFAESNEKTDRIILRTRRGRIQSLRMVGKKYPEIHLGAEEATPSDDGAAAAAAEPAKPPAAGGGGAAPDPFAPPAAGGAAPDPFAPPAGGGAAPDPFAPPAGGGAAPDPFAPPAGGGAAPDPFAPPAGGGAAPDPFAP